MMKGASAMATKQELKTVTSQRARFSATQRRAQLVGLNEVARGLLASEIKESSVHAQGRQFPHSKFVLP